MLVHKLCPALQELTWMASVDDQEKQSSKSWLRHAVESALIALDRPAGFLVPVGAAVVCIKAVSSFLDALLVHQTENAFLGEWASESFTLKFALSARFLIALANKTQVQQTPTVLALCASALTAAHFARDLHAVCSLILQLCTAVKAQKLCVYVLSCGIHALLSPACMLLARPPQHLHFSCAYILTLL